MRRINGGIIGQRLTPQSDRITCASGIWGIDEAANKSITSQWPPIKFNIKILVVGGGGAGGYGRGGVPAGGGGAGGIFYSTNIQISVFSKYDIVVGDATARTAGTGNRISGNSTTFTGLISDTTKTITGLGGGGGGAPNQCNGGALAPGLAGGSGGGSGQAGGAGGAALQSTQNSGICGTNYGNPGGNSGGSGSGGGAGAAGTTGGAGGAGFQFNITGSYVYYGGGGGYGGTCTAGAGGLGGGGSGGYYWNGCLSIRDGSANTGGGGGAGGSSGNVTGGAGGSGVVIINYPNLYGAARELTGSVVQTTTPDTLNTVYKFNSTGSITF